jgi:hypothetical protein
MSAGPLHLVASGDNYTLHLDGGVVVLRVWSRRDMTFARGAALAQAKLEHLRRLIERPGVAALLFDLVDAPAVVGPVTEQAVCEMIGVFAERGRPVAVVVGERPLQALQFTRLVHKVCGPDAENGRGLVTHDRAEADAFVRAAASDAT